MEAIRRIEQVHGNSLTMVLPDAFKEMRVEVIVLPLDEPAPTSGPRRQPHADIAGMGKILGDIVAPACLPEHWEALR
jgi:hypothetical protein